MRLRAWSDINARVQPTNGQIINEHIFCRWHSKYYLLLIFSSYRTLTCCLMCHSKAQSQTRERYNCTEFPTTFGLSHVMSWYKQESTFLHQHICPLSGKQCNQACLYHKIWSIFTCIIEEVGLVKWQEVLWQKWHFSFSVLSFGHKVRFLKQKSLSC